MCVLVVDDDDLVRFLTVSVLEDAGYNTDQANGAAPALDLIRAHPGHFTHLLTDVRMPGSMDGIDLATKVQAEEPSIGIVVISGYNDRRSHQLDGSVQFLAKPWSSADLLKVVARLSH